MGSSESREHDYDYVDDNTHVNNNYIYKLYLNYIIYVIHWYNSIHFCWGSCPKLLT